jgi:hypothetical protein
VYPEIERTLRQYPHRGPRVAFRNMDQGRFENVTTTSGDTSVPHSSRGAAFGDVDNDGDIDVLVMNMNEPPSLLKWLDRPEARRHAFQSLGDRDRRRPDRWRPAAGENGPQPVQLLLT